MMLMAKEQHSVSLRAGLLLRLGVVLVLLLVLGLVGGWFLAGRMLSAIAPNTPLEYKFNLPPANHVFLPGHRIMVQVQSSWFPLYDRNPQTFVPNIFWAKPADYQKAEQKVWHAPAHESFIELPLVKE